MKPGSPEWTRLMTASKVAAALGVSPWQSPYSLWQEMKGLVERPEQTEAQSRGHYLEPAILAWWRDKHGVDGNDMGSWREQPSFTLGDWAAATPDAVAHIPNDTTTVLVEAKSVAYDADWGDEGTDAIPSYYLTQVYWSMHVANYERCYVPIITSRLRFAEYVVDYDPAIGSDLEVRMKAFWDSLAGDTPPPLDNTVATFETVRRLHPDIDDESCEVSEAEAIELLEAVTAATEAEARQRLAKSTVLERMGRAKYATCQGVRIARRQPNKSGVSFVALPNNLPLLNIGEAS